MINLQFNPFNKEIKDLSVSDLKILIGITEGWYIEYKSEVVPTRSISKSLAAFANHYGGLIFYGVKESNDGNHFAGSFPGIDQKIVPSFLDTIRDAAKNINPTPYYEYFRLNGPCVEIGLASEKSIIVIGVPSGPDAPYINLDGKIYRRIADSSDPKAENDRFVLDNLWLRREKANQKLSDFLEEDQVYADNLTNTPYLELNLLPDPLGLAQNVVDINFSEFAEIMSTPQKFNLSNFILFDNIFSMADGFIARSVYNNDPQGATLSWKYYSNGFSKIIIPFASINADHEKFKVWLTGYKFSEEFYVKINSGNYDSCQIIDLNQLLFALMALVTQNRLLLSKSKIIGPYYGKGVLHNLWKRIPFIDTSSYFNFLNTMGIPVIQTNFEYTPPGKSYETFVRLSDLELIKDESVSLSELMFDDTLNLILRIFNGFGLPREAVFPGVEEISVSNEDTIFYCSQRANSVGERRRRFQF